MSQYRLLPTPAQDAVLRDHCGQARYVWNLAVEQHGTGARAGRARLVTWSSAGSSLLRGRSTGGWRPAPRRCSSRRCVTSPGRWPGSSIRATRPGGRRGARPGGMRGSGSPGGAGGSGTCGGCLRKVGQVWVPKAGWVRFRWSRAVPPGVKSYRVTRDRAGRWHVAFAVIPRRFPPPVTARRWASTGGWRSPPPCPPGTCCTPRPDRAGAGQAAATAAHARPCQAGLEPPRPGKHAIARLRARETDRRKDWAEKCQHGHRAAVRRDPGRGPQDRQHDPVRERHAG